MEKDVVTIVWGDSIAFGLYDDELGGWVNRIQCHYEEKYDNYFVFNLGIPGNDSFNILERFETELNYRYNSEDIFRIIFSFGINDVKYFNYDENNYNLFIENVTKILNIAKKYTNNIYFTDLLFPDSNLREIFNPEDIKRVNKELELICEKEEVTLIKISNIINNDDLTDGLHPNNIGHNKIFEKVVSKLGDLSD